MTKYFGFEIDEECDGQFEDMLIGIDPAFHRAIATGVAILCDWYGDKAYRRLDDFFTAVYAAVMVMEDVMEERISHYRPKQLELDFADLEAKDK